MNANPSTHVLKIIQRNRLSFIIFIPCNIGGRLRAPAQGNRLCNWHACHVLQFDVNAIVIETWLLYYTFAMRGSDLWRFYHSFSRGMPYIITFQHKT